MSFWAGAVPTCPSPTPSHAVGPAAPPGWKTLWNFEGSPPSLGSRRLEQLRQSLVWLCLGEDPALWGNFWLQMLRAGHEQDPGDACGDIWGLWGHPGAGEAGRDSASSGFKAPVKPGSPAGSAPGGRVGPTAMGHRGGGKRGRGGGEGAGGGSHHGPGLGSDLSPLLPVQHRREEPPCPCAQLRAGHEDGEGRGCGHLLPAGEIRHRGGR